MKTWGKVLIGTGIATALAGTGYLLWRRRQQLRHQKGM